MWLINQDLKGKLALLYSVYSPECWKSESDSEEACPQTPLKNVDYWPLVDTVSYSIQTCWHYTSTFIETPVLMKSPLGELSLYNI